MTKWYKELACHILRSAGYDVLPARNGRHAEEVFKAHTGKVHLVVSDVVMPEMSGRQLRENLRAFQPDLKFLLVSGYTTTETLGPVDMPQEELAIAKPFSSENTLAESARGHRRIKMICCFRDGTYFLGFYENCQLSLSR